MERIYTDNAGTSCPKPPSVIEAMVRFAKECGVAAGRGSFNEAKICHQILTACRQRMAALINAAVGDGIVFAMNCSEALNIAIRGLLARAPRGTHAIATTMEHNSILRPYHTLAAQNGLEFDLVPCDPKTGIVDPDDVARAVRPTTKLISCIHASNVTGSIQPIAEVAAIARKREIPCLIDASQTAGQVAIDVQALGVDFAAFPGHKSLLGPLGTGLLYIRAGREGMLQTIKEGGTGTQSELMTQPATVPDKFEVGSPNGIGIAGLGEALAWVLDKSVAAIREHDHALGSLFLKLTEDIEGLELSGPRDMDQRVPTFCVNVPGLKPLDLAQRLESEFGVLTRAGLHCAPLAHKTAGTFPGGACRLSFGVFNTEQHVRHAANALAQIAESQWAMPQQDLRTMI
jgi:cysteine desulfurase / selenocysteine lyase